MLRANYHTHTKRCGHAYGEDEEYILTAINEGFDTIGFSDHVMLPNFSQPGWRGDISEAEGYYKSVRDLGEKYKDRLNIYLGYEAESFPQYFPYLKDLLRNGIIDYLVLGNHISIDNNGKMIQDFRNITEEYQLYSYRDLAIQAMESKMFRVFAHPDIFMYNIPNFNKSCLKVTKELIECAMKNNVVLEVNCGGFRASEMDLGNGQKRQRYTTEEFFSQVKKYKAPCIIGIDAHAPFDLRDEKTNMKTIRFAKQLGLDLLDNIDLF